MTDLQVCRALIELGYKPYNQTSQRREFISYPYPADDNRGFAIKIREVGDPTTMTELIIPDVVIRGVRLRAEQMERDNQ